MKSGFKPKNMTKKEWQDNRSTAAKGSGVGKALDAWQKNCPSAINSLNADQLKAASLAVNGLLTALTVAEKKCDKKKQKETIEGIGKYRTIAKNYQKCLKDAAQNFAKRVKFAKEIDGIGAVRKDSTLLKYYLKWAAGPGLCLAQAHGYVLANDKELKKLYTLYVSNGKLNIGNDERKALVAKFKNEETVPDSTMETARNKIISDLFVMLRTTVDDFLKSDLFKEHQRRRFMVPDFSF
ncbi:MAG: hypothetical protein AAF557_14390 [Pseudomonadota bacterium]